MASASSWAEEVARRKTDELLLAWLAREETAADVAEWIRLAKKGELSDENAQLQDLVSSRGSPRRRRAPPQSLPSLRRRSPSAEMPSDQSEEFIASRWPEDEALPLLSFAPLAAEVCQLPTICGPLMYQRLASKNGVTLRDFLAFWRSKLKKLKRRQDRLFVLLTDKKALTRADFEPLIHFVVTTHPGLAFLEEHAEFQQKYAQTVATRIFYRVNLSRTGFISKREFSKANPDVVDALFRLEHTDDVNSELAYFSYEHFYVLYCQFWELDSDKDGKLLRTDLLKYGGHRLSRAIVDRVFEVWSSKHDTMTYPEFVYFMLAEEDKATEASMRYWFECVDVDGDGVIDARDARHFYDIQAQRMECLGHEVVPLPDVLCQMADLLEEPSNTLRLTVDHFLRKLRIAGVFFDALFSLDKFVAFEQRDPFAERLKRDDPFDSDWDRFAATEYSRLATEDDEDDDVVPAAAAAADDALLVPHTNND